MFWFEKNPKTIKNPKEFIDAVLRKFTRVHAGSGGVQLGRYIVDIKDGRAKEKFLNAIKEMIENPDVEVWIREELAFAKLVIKTWKKGG